MFYRMAVIKCSQGTILTLELQVWRNLSATSLAKPCILAGSTVSGPLHPALHLAGTLGPTLGGG